MRTKTTRTPAAKPLGILAVALLGLAPLAAQAAFCPLGMLLPGNPGCERQDSCPTRGEEEGERGPFRKLLGQIETRQAQQMASIQRGVDEGRLGARPTQRLMQEQCDIERQQRRAMADGFLSPYEWAALENAQEQAGEHIHRELRDPVPRG